MRETPREHEGSTAEKKPSMVKRIFLIATLILLGSMAASLLIYFGGTRDAFSHGAAEIHAASSSGSGTFFQTLDGVVLKAGLVNTGGWLCFLAMLVTGAVLWRGRCRRQVEMAEEKTKEWQATAARLKLQLADPRPSEVPQLGLFDLEDRLAKAEERATALAKSNATLQNEIDKRNRSEMALTQKRQELESSKSVLELHVQARTQELQMFQRRYELILNSAGEGICSLDLEGRATFVNPAVAKITGWPIDELIGKTEHEILRRNGNNGNGVNGNAVHGNHLSEQVFYRKDGSRFPAELIKTPINENGRVVGSVLIFKDITERKRAEETLSHKAAELARSNAELEQFAFAASHDLQEPLRKIQAFADRLRVKSARSRSPEILDYLERMQNAAARMQTLINDLLAFSRVIRASQPFTAVEMKSIIKEVLTDLELRIEKSGARVEVDDLPAIEADPMQMRQLMLNLIGNALKFQAPGATPEVKIYSRMLTAPSGEQLCEINVQDNGIGFEEQYLEKIFAVFQRLHGRSEYEGTGVGLAICRRITDRHGGTITAKSKLGEGATFIVTLPLRQLQPIAIS